jgi:hypothetical protein
MRASYALFHTVTGDLYFRRIPFDIDAYKQDLEKAEIPAAASYFLAVADQRTRGPVREALDFHPPAQVAESLAANTRVEVLEEAVKAAKRWRRFAVAALLLLLLTATGTLALWQQTRPTVLVLPAMNSIPRPVPALAEPLCAEPAVCGQLSAENRLPEWSVILTDPEHQNVMTASLTEDGGTDAANSVFRICSEVLAPVRLLSRPVQGQKGMRFTARAQFKPVHWQDGFVEVAVVEKLAGGSERLLINRQPRNLATVDRWLPSSATMDRGLEAESEVQCVIQGEFIGEILIRKNEFFRRQ